MAVDMLLARSAEKITLIPTDRPSLAIEMTASNHFWPSAVSYCFRNAPAPSISSRILGSWSFPDCLRYSVMVPAATFAYRTARSSISARSQDSSLVVRSRSDPAITAPTCGMYSIIDSACDPNPGVNHMNTPIARSLAPSDCLNLLPEPTLDLTHDVHDDQLRSIALRRSILSVAELDHTTETTLVHAAISNALAKQPDTGQ